MIRWTIFAAAVLGVLAGPAAALAAKPDLKVTKISAQPGAVAPGGSLRAGDTVRNTGGAKAKASQVSYHLSLDTRLGNGDLRLAGTRSVLSAAWISEHSDAPASTSAHCVSAR